MGSRAEFRRRFERVLALGERVLEDLAGEPPPAEAFEQYLAFRWEAGHGPGRLQPIEEPAHFDLAELVGVERSVDELLRNTEQFVRGLPCNHVLLHGERGTGKSSAVRGLLRELGPKGLRLVEVQRDDLHHLGRLYSKLRGRAECFGLFCDDLSFEAGDASYKPLKAALDGGLEARPENVILMATSNRRHLIPEYMSENLEATISKDGELHPGETAEEKISLSDRFGLLLPFFSFNQDTYLEIVDYHAREIGLDRRLARDEIHERALRFALDRAGRSGRTARQACVAILQEVDGAR